MRKRKDFHDVYSKGAKFYTENLLVFILKNLIGVPRIGITVTKKYGKSFKRNRIKRLIREFFRLNKSLFREGYDYLFVVKKECWLQKLDDVELELIKLLNNEKIYNF